MQGLCPHPGPTESEGLGMGPGHLLNKALQEFCQALMFENHRPMNASTDALGDLDQECPLGHWSS